MKHQLLHDGLEFWRSRTPEKVALIHFGHGRLTYRELGLWSDGIAAHLQAQGVGPGDLVGITGANCLEFVAGGMGVLKAGATLSPFNERFTAPELQYAAEFSGAKLVIADEPRAALLRAAGSTPILPMETLGQYRAGAPDWRAPYVASEQAGMLIFTSGTTGRPKGAIYRHGDQVGGYHQLQITGQLSADTRHLMTVALTSAVGTVWFPFLFTIGGVFVFLTRYRPDTALQAITQEKITWMTGFPMLLEQVSREPDFAAADLSSLTRIFTGGARIPPETVQRWRDKGVRLQPMFGQTEIGGYATIASDREVDAGKLSCGNGMLHTKIRVVDADGKDCQPGERGEILMQGPSMMAGYWRDPETTARTIVDGWLHSGDIGMFDEEGDLHFVDRAKDLIITGGFNVAPMEVENVIAEVEGVLEVAVIPVPDEKFGETPAACVYSTAPVSEQLIFAHCKTRMAGFKLPRYIIPFAEPLPRTAGGKLDKVHLKSAFADAPSRFSKLA